MSALASVSDLEIRLRAEVASITGADLAAPEAALDDASTLVAAAAAGAGLEIPWTLATIPEVARRVVICAVLRTYRNPDGYVSEAMGSGAYSYRYADDETSAYLTEAEASLVARAAAQGRPDARPFAGSIRTPSPYGAADDAAPWWFTDALA